MNSAPFCAEVARQENAPLAGTASRAESWILLEHRAPWGSRAVEEDLPAPVQEWLQRQLAALPRARPLLVRRPGRESSSGEGSDQGSDLVCWLVRCDEQRRELYRITVADHAGLVARDLAAELAAGALEPARSDARLVVVCTNGRRDRCCARLGVAAWRALVDAGAEAWESSHQGGHRHAASALLLPEGVSYGYLDGGDAPALLAARGRSALLLPRYRGRCFHAPPAQAADALLRSALGEDALDAWQTIAAHESEAGEWQVDLAGATGVYRVALRETAEEALVSCSPAKHKPIRRFDLIAWEGA